MTTHAFEAEVAQVLHLVIHSLYRNKEIFLRELVSNASDALDKRRFRAITETALAEDNLHIRLLPDVDAGTLTIWDNGVGMTHDELVTNLGTVAKSGTRAFLEQLENGRDDVQLIGQFGVGFYSAFLVADRVEVVSRAAGTDDAHVWRSDGKSEFTVEPGERADAGTTITLHLNDEFKEQFTREWSLRDLVRRYSDYVSYPIQLEVTRTEKNDDDDEETTTRSLEQVNEANALWKRAPEDITEEQYEEFYRHLTRDYGGPLAHTHFKVEGSQEFTSLLFIPGQAPFDLFDQNSKHGVRLYVNRVFIMDDCEELLPVWLRFMRGVVDSSDLPLNVSRDVLQDSRAARVIKKRIAKKSLELIESLATDNPEDYATFWDAFGRVFKEGVHYDASQRETVAKLSRFRTTGDDEWTTLDAYIARMPEGQEDIYYAVGQSAEKLAASPHLEGLKAKGYEVLLMTDTIDQWFVDSLAVYDDKKLVSAMQADLDLSDDEGDDETDTADKPKSAELGAFGDAVKEVLGDKIADVKASSRLSDSPVCLVFPKGGVPSHIERLLREHQGGLPSVKRVLELNPTHPLVSQLKSRHDADGIDSVRDHIELLYDQALLLEGTPLDDPAQFAKRMTSLMMGG